MTCIEMRTEAELLYESINSSDAPGFSPTEWALILTVAQRKVVNRILREGINKNAYNQLAIEKLVKPDVYADLTATNTHFRNTDGTLAQTIDVGTKVFDPDFFWILDEYVNTASKNNIRLHRITYDFYRSNLQNPFRIPDVDEGYWVLQYNNVPVFITDGTTLTSYNIVGVEHPDNYPIGIATPAGDCILNEGVHSKIVEEAVTLARMSVVDPQGYQLALAEFAKE